MEQVDYKGFAIQIDTDSDPTNPREWDNLGIMSCSHSRYTLGDKEEEITDDYGDWLASRLGYFDLERLGKDGYTTESWNYMIEVLEWGEGHDDYSAMIDKAWDILDTRILKLPLYLYDHSGITMNTTGFSCRWDSGSVGFIWVDKDDIRKEYGVKRISKKLKEKVYGILRSEVEIYDDYLTGNVYGYQIQDSEGEDKDSCWGYFGYDHDKSGLMDAAQSQIDYYTNQEKAA